MKQDETFNKKLELGFDEVMRRVMQVKPVLNPKKVKRPKKK